MVFRELKETGKTIASAPKEFLMATLLVGEILVFGGCASIMRSGMPNSEQFSEQKSGTSMEKLKQIIEKYPGTLRAANAYHDMGIIYFYDKHDPWAAIECFDKILEINPRNQLALFNRGLLYTNIYLGGFFIAWDDAEWSFKRLIELNPNDPKMHDQLAEFYDKTYYPKKAEEQYKIAKELEDLQKTFKKNK